ncbi:Hypothetical predicted protein [Podarcis lilfordi]|uniref:Uncharacterized protein n=1 Tax=Podarcis lilfordi TaxID=74358 RepID=A0AA35LIZ7_9SAUR|nr:Hypothetical predicted protein [Podarcis lilfordi]
MFCPTNPVIDEAAFIVLLDTGSVNFTCTASLSFVPVTSSHCFSYLGGGLIHSFYLCKDNLCGVHVQGESLVYHKQINQKASLCVTTAWLVLVLLLTSWYTCFSLHSDYLHVGKTLCRVGLRFFVL